MLDVKTPEEVLEMIKLEFAPADCAQELVPLSDAMGRILAEDICANEYVPDFDRSTVDGYAVRARDTFGCSDAIPAILSVTGEVFMGKAPDCAVMPSCCCAVPTGGAVPEGADSVVMIEYTEDYGDGTIGVSKPSAPGQNMIFRGDDVFPGKKILPRSRRLTAGDIGALAAVGRVEVPVKKKLRAAIISTGDELVSPDETPQAGQVRDVNGPMLTAMIKDCGAEPVYYGSIVDDEELIEKTVKKAIAECDMVLISGGSSVGIKDAACRIIESVGKLILHGIAIKPGKPTIMGKCGDKPVVGLPGHPVAAYFVTELFVLPLIMRLIGQETEQVTKKARLSENVSANHGRAQYLGCRLVRDDDGFTAVPIRSKSGLITQLAGADGYFCIDRDCEGLPKGAEVEVKAGMAYGI